MVGGRVFRTRLSPSTFDGPAPFATDRAGAAGLQHTVSGLLLDASVPGAAMPFCSLHACRDASPRPTPKKLLQERLQRERESAARLAGELDAADASRSVVFHGPSRIPFRTSLRDFAAMEPRARWEGHVRFLLLDAEHYSFSLAMYPGRACLPASSWLSAKLVQKYCPSDAGRRVMNCS